MPSKFYIVSLFYLLTIPATGQQNVSIGKPYTPVDSNINHYFYKDDEILAVKVSSKGIVYLQKFNSISLTNIATIRAQDLPKNSKVEDVIAFQSRYFLFYSTVDRKKFTLFQWEINFTTGDFTDFAKPIITLNAIPDNFPHSTTTISTVRHKFNFIFSPDSSSLAIQYLPHHEHGASRNQHVGIFIFNQNLKEIKKINVSIPHTKNKLRGIDCFLDSQGNTYILTQHFEKKQIKWQILAVTSHDSLAPVHLTSSDKLYHTGMLFEDKTGRVRAIGLYTDHRNKTHKTPATDGLFLFTLSGSEIPEPQTWEIPANILTQNRSRREIHKIARLEHRDKAEFENLVLQKIKLLKDGSTLIIGEQRYFYSANRPPKESYLTNNKKSSHNFHNRDIFLTKIDADDSLKWIKKLPRHQVHEHTNNRVGFEYAIGNTTHYFYYIDDKANLMLKTTDVPVEMETGEDGHLIQYAIDDGTGTTTKTLLLNSTPNSGEKTVYSIQENQMVHTTPTTLLFESTVKRKGKAAPEKEEVLIKIELQ